MNAALGHLINGKWTSPPNGTPLTSTDPATGAAVWTGHAAGAGEVELAAAAARQALPAWCDTPEPQRLAILQRYAELLKLRRQNLAEAISTETGKPMWESLTEVDAMAAKVPISNQALQERRQPIEREQAGVISATRYKPMGVMAVLGPFNMPGHLPNGHIVPALLAGNAIVFKPSELTPGVGQAMAELLVEAGVPHGVVNLVQGGRETGALLAASDEVDGVLFTGSAGVGQSLARSLLESPHKILALEMGGNSPLVVWEPQDLDAAAYLTIQSAYITSGQRCSCARRLIVPKGQAGDAFLNSVSAMIATIFVGPHTLRPEPFMGPVISDAAAERLLAAQHRLIGAGGKPIAEMAPIGDRPAMLSPGLIDMTFARPIAEQEIFGPLLQVTRCDSFSSAIELANRSEYGLAAGLFCDDVVLWKRFYREIRAGVVYWNRQTTGGSSALPFGGIGASGNYRPSGYWAADYCSYPVASIESSHLALPTQRTPGIGDAVM